MSDRNRIKATETAFEILDYLQRNDGASARDIAQACDLSRQGVYKHLRTLEATDAVNNRNGVFVLGPRLAEYGLAVQNSNTIYTKYKSKIDNLAVSLDAPVNLWSPEGNKCICLYQSLPNEGRENPRNQGESELLADSVPGKTILAEYSTGELAAHLDEYSDSYDLDEIRTHIRKIQERDLLIESLTDESSWMSITTSICKPSGRPEGAIEVVMPHERARGIDIEVHVAGSLLDAVDKIELDLFSSE